MTGSGRNRSTVTRVGSWLTSALSIALAVALVSAGACSTSSDTAIESSPTGPSTGAADVSEAEVLPDAVTPTVEPTFGRPTAKPIPLPTPDTSGALVGAAALRDSRPPATPTPVPPTPEPSTPGPQRTPVPTPTLPAAPEPQATAEPIDTGGSTSTPEPTTPADTEIPVPDGSAGLGALRTPSGVLAGIVGGTEGAWEIVSPCNNVVTLSSGELVATPVVLIDPGHGGTETGAVGPDGLIEKDANLAVALELEQWLEAAGISTELVRDRDYRMAIRARTTLANALQPLLFVSVHHNGGSSMEHTAAPVEVFYQEFSTDSKRLAGLVHEELFAAMDPLADTWSGTPFQGAQPRFNNEGGTLYGILRRSIVPTVITEAFYMDNAGGEALMNDPAVVTAEAAALGVAIQRFLTTTDPGSGFVDGQSFTLGNSSGGTDGCVDPPLE